MPEEAPESLDPIIELQALELARLLRDNKRLNQRIDFLIGEIKWLRKLQERELALRENEQAMHRAAQDTIKGLIAKPAAGPAAIRTGETQEAGTHADPAVTDLVLEASLAGFAEHPLGFDTAAGEPEPADEPALPAFLTAGTDTTFGTVAATSPADPETAWDDGATAVPERQDGGRNKRFGLWNGRLGRNRLESQNSALSDSNSPSEQPI